MGLSRDWKNSIRFKNKIGDAKGAERDLLKIKMMYYNKLNTTDKLFISYCLAFLMYKKNNQEIANSYLNEIREIFNHEDTKDYRVEYHNFLWLNVNVNYKNMSNKDIKRDMLRIKKYYDELGDYANSLGALTNIYSLSGDGDTVLKLLKELLLSNIYIENRILNSFLEDLMKLNQELYIEGKIIIDNYIKTTKVN